MVILITGASHTGKTFLAQRLLEQLHIPYLSEDHLKMGLIRSGQTQLTPEDDEKLTAYLWPIVREIIKTAIENCQDLIVEGCYFPFDWRRGFDERYQKAIRFICLAMSDAYLDAHFDDVKRNASAIEHRLDDSYCTIDRMKAENRAYIAGFRKAGEPVTFIEDDFSPVIRAILKEQNSEQENHMIVLNVLYRCKPECREAFLNRIGEENIDVACRAEDGNLQYDYFIPTDGSDGLLLVEKWRDAEALAAHGAQPHMAALRAIKSEYVIDTQIERFEP